MNFYPLATSNNRDFSVLSPLPSIFNSKYFTINRLTQFCRRIEANWNAVESLARNGDRFSIGFHLKLIRSNLLNFLKNKDEWKYFLLKKHKVLESYNLNVTRNPNLHDYLKSLSWSGQIIFNQRSGGIITQITYWVLLRIHKEWFDLAISTHDPFWHLSSETILHLHQLLSSLFVVECACNNLYHH